MKRIFNYFLQGLLYIAPISLTLYLFYLIFDFTDSILEEFLVSIFKRHIPGLGFVIIFFFLVLTGLIGQSIIARPFRNLLDRLLNKVPLLKLIYSAMSDLFSAFVGKERKFNRPVSVKLNPESSVEKLGFMTDEDLNLLSLNDKVAVYFPHSYNFSGELFIVPRAQVRALNIDPATLMKFIVSGGVSGISQKTNIPD